MVYCDLSCPGLSEAMRVAVLERESRPIGAMTGEERLEHIWSSTANGYRGYARDRWPEDARGQRTVILYGGPDGTFLKLLTELSNDEISAKLPVHLRHLPAPIAA
jgi:hypothetical protein